MKFQFPAKHCQRWGSMNKKSLQLHKCNLEEKQLSTECFLFIASFHRSRSTDFFHPNFRTAVLISWIHVNPFNIITTVQSQLHIIIMTTQRRWLEGPAHQFQLSVASAVHFQVTFSYLVKALLDVSVCVGIRAQQFNILIRWIRLQTSTRT